MQLHVQTYTNLKKIHLVKGVQYIHQSVGDGEVIGNFNYRSISQ